MVLLFNAVNNFVVQPNEAVFVDWLKTAIETAIANAQALLLESEEKWAEFSINRPGVRDATLSLSRAEVITSPDQTFSFTDDTNPQVETVIPIIIIETIGRTITQRSAQGSRIYGASNFNITILISRNSREAYDYKNELINMVNYIEQILLSNNTVRLSPGDIDFADIRYKDVGCTSAIIPLEVSINNFDYTIQE